MLARRILLVDNQEHVLDAFKSLLEHQGYAVVVASSLSRAREILKSDSVQLIITDLRATDDSDEHDRSGLVFARDVAPSIPKIIFTSYPSFKGAQDALQADADLPHRSVAINYLSKRESPERLLEVVAQAFQRYVLLNPPQFKIGGALVGEDSALYVPRRAEREIIECLEQMDYVLLIEPRQQGKTSLINYLLRCPELSEKVFAYIDISTADHSSQRAWYESVCTRIVRQLSGFLSQGPPPPIPGNVAEWRSFLSELCAVCNSRQQSLVIIWDEIATPIPESGEVFGVLRDVFNSRQAEPQFKRLTFVLVGAFHPRDLVTDDGASPFNIARRIRLPDFTLAQTWTLARNIASTSEQADLIATRIFHWAGGQPYLTQLLCTYLNKDASTTEVDRAVNRLRLEEENHLPPLMKRVQANNSLTKLLDRISNGERIRFSPRDTPPQLQLQTLGVIGEDAYGNCTFRNRIYERYFSEHISESHSIVGFLPRAPITILFLAAEPTDASRLRLGQELRDIQERLQMAKGREGFSLKQRMSVRPIDISQSILDENPQIVHFAGHGTGAGELCFENELGEAAPVSAAALGSLFELVSKSVICVLMNACYSAVQASAIAEHIQYVIGMDKAIGDRAALSFATGFYQALGAGRAVEEAYRFGCVQIKLQGIREDLTPVLLRRH